MEIQEISSEIEANATSKDLEILSYLGIEYKDWFLYLPVIWLTKQAKSKGDKKEKKLKNMAKDFLAPLKANDLKNFNSLDNLRPIPYIPKQEYKQIHSQSELGTKVNASKPKHITNNNSLKHELDDHNTGKDASHTNISQ